MKTITNDLELLILQQSSGNFLSNTIPNNWFDLSEKEQEKFLKDNAWEPFEGYSIDFLWEHIESTANHWIQLMFDQKLLAPSEEYKMV